MDHVVIIGNGISGITAARHIRKLSQKKITVVSSESKHFFSRTALMYVYMGHMKFEHTKPYENWFWKKNRIDLKYGFVTSINTSHKLINLENDDALSYDQLIIATGSLPNRFGWPGENLKGVQGLYSKQDLESLEIYAPGPDVCRRAVIVGGGLIGIELAEMLHSRKIPVTLLVRESGFWNNVLPDANSQLIDQHIRAHGIDLRLNSELEAIKSDASGRVNAVIVKGTDEEISCQFVGLAAGVSPNLSCLKSSNIETDRGVLVNRFLETNIKDVYAIGDCAQQREAIGARKSIEAVWYTGRMMGETVAQTICGRRMKYKPSHWFNSAKFFEIEYQTYGWVFSKPKDNHNHFHWQHQEKPIAITIEYHKDSLEFKGINTFGIRMRHDIFDSWLTQKRRVDEVIRDLAKANFDPEFFKAYEPMIQLEFQKQLQINAPL